MKKHILTLYSLQKTRNRRFRNVLICLLILASFFHNLGLIFPSFVHYFLMFFWNRSREPFLEAKCANRRSKVVFWSHFRRHGGSQNLPSEPFQNRRHFRPKMRPRRGSRSSGRPPGAVRGATWHSKRSSDPFSFILDRFLVNFGPISDGFLINFLWICD